MDDVWAAWARRWDRFQECYVPHREAQLSLMLDYVELWCPHRPLRILDLCSGPGTVADRALRRRPDAEVVAVDGDAWLLELGRRSIAGVTWVEADLREEGWEASIPGGAFHAALSMTALHWLDHTTLARVYSDLARLLEPEAVLLNADLIPAGDGLSPVAAIGREQYFRRQAARVRTRGPDWGAFWADAHQEGTFAELLARRDRRLGRRPGVRALSADGHRDALSAAGFRDVGEIWRLDAAAILMAVR